MMRASDLLDRRLGAGALLATTALVATVTAHVRLASPSGPLLFWNGASNISIAISSRGSDDVPGAGHETAIRSAMEEWNRADGSRARFVEDFDGWTRSRTDWESDDVRLVMFDENDSSGFFAGASGTVAITPIAFRESGAIVDADVLFNGKDFRFTTSNASGRFDVQDLATHELGHLLGLDHSGVCGSTMYPYVDPTVVLHRSLSLDDRGGVRHAYPMRDFARITGRVLHEDAGGSVRGAHVVARDASGRVAGATLTSDDGRFALEGLDPGSYVVYANPLDQPVSIANIGSVAAADTAFETTGFGTVQAASGATIDLGSRTVGADSDVSLGRVSDNCPRRLVAGETRTLVVRGSGLTAGSALTLSDPTLSLTNITWFGASVHFDVTVPAASAPGHVDLAIDNPAQGMDVLVGGIEITPPDPAVASVVPASGSPEGGDAVTISGDHFRRGARVVIGDRIYRDGAAAGCQVVDSNTIRLTTEATIAGDHDVVVIDRTGVEGREANAFEVVVAPTLGAAFPAVGAAAGGTLVLLSGTSFVPGSIVQIDGVVQPSVSVESPSRMRVVTRPAQPGGPFVLTVTSPSGDTADAAFTYVPDPDPSIAFISPRRGDRSGGTTVTIEGSGFTSDSRVVVGASGATGGGGAPAATTFVDATTLRATMPAYAIGATNVLVRNVATGQAALSELGFVYTSADDDDVGGCAAVIAPGPPGWRRVVGGSGWILVLLLLGAYRARRVPRPAPAYDARF